MESNDLWELLNIATSSLSIGVGILLWFLNDYLRLLEKVETEGKPTEYRDAARSTRSIAVFAGVLLILVPGIAAIYVAWMDRELLGLMDHGRETGLLLLSLLFPIAGALVAAIALLTNIGVANLFWAFSELFARIRPRPVELKIENLKLVEPVSHQGPMPTAPIVQEWETAYRWVESNQAGWGLGRTFLIFNRKVLISLVDREWEKLRASRSQIASLPGEIVPYIEAILIEKNLTKALIRKRPESIAKAACAMYLYAIQKRTGGK